MVSIIIPCYNAESSVKATISSVLLQSDPDWEIIAVDDGSNDSTLSLLRQLQSQDSRIHVIHQKNKGVSTARNNGIQHASGDWLYFLDADDLIEDSLVRIINSQNEDTKMIVFDFIEKTKNKTRIHKIRNLETIFPDYLVNRQTIHISSMVVKRNLISSNNIYFDENTYYGEDREFVANLLTLRPKIRHINSMLFTYVFRDGSAMTNKTYSERRFSSVLACERTYKKLFGTTEEKRALTVLAFTIVCHIKMFQKYNCKDIMLKRKLNNYRHKYLDSFQFHGWGKIELYTTIACYLSHINGLFRLFLKFF